MTKKFPDTLYVKREKDSDTEYFVSDADAGSLLDQGDKTVIATYQLVEVQTGTLIPQFSRPSRSKGVSAC